MKKQAYLALSVVSIAMGQDAWTERMSLANRLQAEGKYEEARVLYESSVTESAQSKKRYAQALNNLAAHYYETGKYTQAEPMYRKALDEWRALDETGRLGVTLSNLATLYRKTGRFKESIGTFDDAETHIRKAHGIESPEMVSCLVNRSEVYRVSGRLADAETTAAKALAISEKIFNPTDVRVSHSLHAYAAALHSNGRAAETGALHERALTIRERAYGDSHPYVAATLTAIVSLYIQTARYAEAEPLAARALAIWESKLGAEHPNTAVALNNMAQVYRFLENNVAAEPLYRRSVEILEKRQSPDAVKPLTNLGDFYLQRGREAAAIAFYKRAEEVARNAFGETDPQTAAVMLKIAGAYDAMGRKTEAAKLYKEARVVRIATAP